MLPESQLLHYSYLLKYSTKSGARQLPCLNPAACAVVYPSGSGDAQVIGHELGRQGEQDGGQEAGGLGDNEMVVHVRAQDPALGSQIVRDVMH